MDVDISDILADVSRLPAAYLDDSTSTSHLSDGQSTVNDYQRLVRVWISERAAPALLPYPTDLISRVMSRVREQISRIEDLTSDPTSYAPGPSNGLGARGVGGPPSTQNLNLVLSVLQTDLSRTQFLVRSLLRQRLAKITKHAMFYLKGLQGDVKKNLLGDSEIRFLQNHQALLSELYGASFLNAVPLPLRRLDDSAGGDRMVEGPDELAAVFVRCLAEVWDSEGMDHDPENTTDDVGQASLRMVRGEAWIVRWRDVKAGVIKGELELL